MVGKIKHVRQKLHQEAVKLRGLDRTPQAGPEPVLPAEPGSEKAPPGREVPTQTGARARQVPSGSSFPSSVFVGTKISPETLIQRLDHPEPADVPQISRTGSEEEKKRATSKKEKMKERRERWLSKISSIKQVKEQQLAEARRKATPVVGDMQPLADALPQLSELMGPAAAAAPTSRRKSRKNKLPVKKAVPTDFSQMKQAQKRRLLETESLSFSRAVKAMATMKNPLADIGEQLRKRMRQEEEQAPS